MSKKKSIHKTDFSKKSNNLTLDTLLDLKKNKVIDDFFYKENFILMNGECLKVMGNLIFRDIKFDHIITDIPYGTVQGLTLEGWKKKGNIPLWDSPIDLKIMIPNCFNLSKSNSNLLLFSQEPMTFKLLNEVNNYQKYKLSNKMIWLKNNHANGFSAKTTPVNVYEEVLLFRKSLDETNSLEIRKYFKAMLDFIGLSKKEIMNNLGQGLDHCFRFNNRTFYIPTEINYDALIKNYHIDSMESFISYDRLKNMWDSENDTVFNRPKNSNIVRNVFEYKKDTKNIHPTQKPISLLNELINLFTNENDTIFDFTCGSGSCGIAAVKNNRKFVGIELDKQFFSESINWYKNEFN